jgi:pilus assembly protein CpaB
VPAVVATRDIPARTAITAGMVEIKQVPVDDRSDLAFSDTSQVVGQVTRYPIAEGEHILSTKVVALTGAAAEGESLSFVVPPDMRGVAITVDQVIGSGGLVLPGDYVDVIAVFDVDFRVAGQDPTSRETQQKFFASTILQNVEVLAVAQTIVDTPPESTTADNPDQAAAATSQRARNTEASPNPDASTVTLAVTLDDAQKIFVAEENGVLRLAVRPYGDDKIENVNYFTELELLPPDLPNPFQR